MRAAIWPTDRTLPHMRLTRNGKQVFSLLLRTSPAGPMFDRRDLRSPLVRLHRQIQVPWRRRGLARQLAQLMRNAPWVEPALELTDSVIAMPMSASRLRERGFNQAYELAKHLAPQKADAKSLLRLEHAIHQVGATRAERLAQARNTFWIDPNRIPTLQGQRVVLLDDVMTTGATMFEAARTLRKAGVAHITGLVFARAQLAES